MYVLASLGVGEMFGSLMIGQVIDNLGHKVTSVITLYLILLQTVLSVMYIYLNTYGGLAYVLAITWGI